MTELEELNRKMEPVLNSAGWRLNNKTIHEYTYSKGYGKALRFTKMAFEVYENGRIIKDVTLNSLLPRYLAETSKR